MIKMSKENQVQGLYADICLQRFNLILRALHQIDKVKCIAQGHNNNIGRVSEKLVATNPL